MVFLLRTWLIWGLALFGQVRWVPTFSVMCTIFLFSGVMSYSVPCVNLKLKGWEEYFSSNALWWCPQWQAITNITRRGEYIISNSVLLYCSYSPKHIPLIPRGHFPPPTIALPFPTPSQPTPSFECGLCVSFSKNAFHFSHDVSCYPRLWQLIVQTRKDSLL